MVTNLNPDDATQVAEPLAKILCVDDDPGMLTAVSRLLERDFSVLLARNVDEASTQMEAHPEIAIVLVDQSLPEMKGLDFLSRVQMQLPDAVRALFSGHLEVSELVEAINTSRIHRLILKPWDNDYFRIQMLEALANHSILREKRELEALSITDPVTGLKNHRYFQDRLRIEIERAVRHDRQLGLVMIDIDHFKDVNDRYGHPVGDLVLKGVALRLLDQVRSLDTVARYGGEEFTILMPDTPYDSVLKVADRIRLCFAEKPFCFPQTSEIAITISLGVAAAPRHARTAPDLVQAADAAVYRAKGQGRNQTVGA